MQDKLKVAREADTLKPYDLTNAQVGDKVDLPFTTPCEVIAIHNDVVVLGQVEGAAVFPYPQNTPFVDHRLCHLPIAWLGDDPIYIGTVLYSTRHNGSWNVVRKTLWGRGCSIPPMISSRGPHPLMSIRPWMMMIGPSHPSPAPSRSTVLTCLPRRLWRLRMGPNTGILIWFSRGSTPCPLV